MDKGVKRALTISLALHAILLWQVLATTSGVLSRMQASPRAEVLSAVLHPVTDAPLLRPEPLHRAEAAQRSTNAMSITSPSSSAQVAAQALTAPQTRNPPTATNTTNEPRTIVVPPSASSTSDEAALDANGLRQYRVSLAVAARRFRNFPAQALANGLSGTAEIRISIAANGMPQPPQLEHTSGHDLLDAAALQMLGNALQNTRLPESLHGHSFSLRLPVEFGMVKSEE